MKLCIECKTQVVHYYRSEFCKDCIKDFFEGDEGNHTTNVSSESIWTDEQGSDTIGCAKNHR